MGWSGGIEAGRSGELAGYGRELFGACLVGCPTSEGDV